MPDPALTDDIIEAAAEAIAYGALINRAIAEQWWEKLPESTREGYRKTARHALAVAVPRLRAHIADQNDAELRLTEGDLTVAVHEATRARSVLRNADATSAELRRQLVGTNALLATVERQRQAVLDLCDEGEQLGKQLVWIGELRTALGATREGNV
jgi:hypothetical protein